jgi:D-alanyl-D-alanine carboxypeptidase
VAATKEPVTPETPFAIASVTKTFTSALILRLAEQGKLSLNDKLSRWVPTYPDASKLTIRMLLNHTSGLDDFFQNPKFDKALTKDRTYVWTPEQVLAFDSKYFDIVYAQPGTNWHYSNTNYLLLGLVAERAGGGSWASLVHRELLDPLGLSSTIVQGVDQPTVRLAHANEYASMGANSKVVLRDLSDGTAIAPFTSVTTAAFAAGSLASTSGDLARWAKLLYSGNVLSLASRKQLLTFVPAARWYYSTYGLGVSKATFNGHGAYGHTGALAGSRSATRWFPKDKVAMAALFNWDGIVSAGDKGYRGDDVLKYLADVLWPPKPKPGASARP